MCPQPSALILWVALHSILWCSPPLFLFPFSPPGSASMLGQLPVLDRLSMALVLVMSLFPSAHHPPHLQSALGTSYCMLAPVLNGASPHKSKRLAKRGTSSLRPFEACLCLLLSQLTCQTNMHLHLECRFWYLSGLQQYPTSTRFRQEGTRTSQSG